MIRQTLHLLRRSIVSAYGDNILGTAKGAAYSALLAFFPILTSITLILVRMRAEDVSRILSGFLLGVAPPGTEDLIRYSIAVRGERPLTLPIVAVLLSIYAASGVMMSLMEGFRAAYRIPRSRPFWPQRGVAVALVFLAAVPAVAASVLILFGGRAEEFVMSRLGLLRYGENLRGGVAAVAKAARYGTAFTTLMLVISLLYHFGPNRPRRYWTVWPGAALATVLWLLATIGFGWYVRNIANYNVLYGSIGAVIALLVWMFVLAVVTLIGCEFNAERERFLAVTRSIENPAPPA